MQKHITVSIKAVGIALVAVFFVALATVASSAYAADLSAPTYSGGNSYSGGSGTQYSGGHSSTPSYSGGNTSYSGGSGTQYSGGNASTPTYSGGNTTYSGGNGTQYSGGNPITPTYSTPTYTTGTVTYITGGGCSSNCGGTVINPPPAPTCTISASPSSITQGQAVTITWSSSNAQYGNIQNLGTNLPASGSYTLYLNQSTVFTGTFYGYNGQQVTCVTNVGVLPPPQYCPAGYTGTYPNCYPPVQNNPSCTITINNYGNNYSNNNYYNPNTAVTISWNSTNAQSGYLNQGLGSVGLSGTRTIYPTQTTTYTGTFYGYNGQSVTCSATVYINNNTYVPPVYPATPYVTLTAVPYTGLDLGPVGTVVYWGFLAFWCALAAYLIIVKRVQNGVYTALKSFLFGGSTVAVAHTVHSAAHVTYTTPVVRNEDKTDDFILSQINRARA